MRPDRLRASMLLLAALIVIVPMAARAAPAALKAALSPPAPQRTTASYGDWTVDCARDTGKAGVGASPATAHCTLEQTITVRGQAAPVARLTIGIDPESGAHRIVAELPVGAWLPTPPALDLPGLAEPVQLTYKRCLPVACLADADFTAALSAAMKAAVKPGNLIFQITAGKDIKLPISFAGYAAAQAALVRDGG